MGKMPGHTYEFKVLLRVYLSLLALAAVMVTVSLLPTEAVGL